MNNLSKVKEIRKSDSYTEINGLLATGNWRIAHEQLNEHGQLEYVLYRMK